MADINKTTIHHTSTGQDAIVNSSGRLEVAILESIAIASGTSTSVIYDGTTALTPKFAVINAATSGNNTLVAAVTAKKIRVVQFSLVLGAATTVRFESGADGTALTGLMEFAANSGISPGYCPIGFFETAANTLLNLELSAANNADGWLVYVEV